MDIDAYAHEFPLDADVVYLNHAGVAPWPRRTMTAFELNRYLDYCSELLSLTSKLAALYVQDFNDPVVLSAVSEVETLCGGLAGKIWQKITMLEPGRLPGSDEPDDSR